MTIPDPTQSWVAKWQRLDGYVGGVYAVKVAGVVSVPTFSFTPKRKEGGTLAL